MYVNRYVPVLPSTSLSLVTDKKIAKCIKDLTLQLLSTFHLFHLLIPPQCPMTLSCSEGSAIKFHFIKYKSLMGRDDSVLGACMGK